MELLLICVSLWILQCNSARADSIIHIGKGPLHYLRLLAQTSEKAKHAGMRYKAHSASLSGCFLLGGRVKCPIPFAHYFVYFNSGIIKFVLNNYISMVRGEGGS